MRRSILFIVSLCIILSSTLAAERQVILVTPNGVYRSIVKDGVPGPWVAQNDIDVIVHGIKDGGDVPKPPMPPPVDTISVQVETISKSLQDKEEALAVLSLVNSLHKLGLSGDNFRQSLEMASGIADTSMQAEGRITRWVSSVLKITADPAKMMAGLYMAWDVSPDDVTSVHAQATRVEGAAVSRDAEKLLKIIQMIETIINLLKNLGII